MNFKFWNKKEIQEAPKNKEVTDRNLKNIIIKAVGLIVKQGAGRENFCYPEYDLEEIRIASLSDSYIKQALSKYSYLIFKAGYTLKSENEEASEYVKTRLRIMGFATQKPVEILFQEVTDDLIKYSNAFLIKSRVDFIMPGVRAKGMFGDKPVGGYYRICPSTIRVKRDDNGKIIKYQQFVNGKEKNYPAKDVVHMYLDKEPNNVFGTPRIIAALEDVKLLRKIEGNIISLIYRFAIPIYQWMIGIPELGFQATEKEINEAKNEIEKMSMDGVIVTNERTQVKAIGAEGEALDASNYLLYFEKRVFTALGVSESQMGRGGSKQDADSMEAQVHDVVKHIQRVFGIFKENFIINELLFEGGFNPIVNSNDIVKCEFEEISLDTKVKVENHEMLKFQSNVSTSEETRRKLGKKEEVDENRLYASMIENKKAIEQIREKTAGAVEVQKARASSEGSGGVAGNGSTKNTKGNSDVKSRNNPSNQHGTTSVKIKESLDDSEVKFIDVEAKNKENHKKTYHTVYKRYKELRNDICRDIKSLDILIPISKDGISKEIKNYMNLASRAGSLRAIRESDERDSTISPAKVNLNIIEDIVDSKIKGLLKDIKSKINESKDPESVFDTLEYRIRFLIEYVIPKSYWYSYIKTCSQIGVKKVFIDFDGSEDEKGRNKEIDTKNFSLEDIPAYHPFCNCEVTQKAGEDK